MKTNYENWSIGKAWIGAKEYHTLNPPSKESAPRKLPEPKDEIIYRDMFILRPVYRSQARPHGEHSITFLGYILVVRDSGSYWKRPLKLAEAKAHADAVIKTVRACDAIASAVRNDQESVQQAA